MESAQYNTEEMLAFSNETANNKTLSIDMIFNNGHLVSIIGYSLLFIIGSFGNLTLLKQVYRYRKNTSITYLIVHLTIGDLCVIFLLIPLEIVWAGTVQWYAGDAICRIMSFFRTFGIYLTGFVTICISLDRVFAVYRPLSVADSLGRAKTMVGVAWVGSVMCSFPQSIIFHVEHHPDFTWYKQCVTFNFFTSRTYELIYNYSGFVGMYAFPNLMIILCYGSILWKLNRILRSPNIEGRENVFGRAKIQTLKMTGVIVSAFFLCWTPYNVMSLWYWIDKESAEKVDQVLQKLLFIFAVMTSCVNPFVYGYFNTQNNRNQPDRVITYQPPRVLLARKIEVISSHTHSTSGNGGNNRHFFGNDKNNFRVLVRWNRKSAKITVTKTNNLRDSSRNR